MERSIRWLALLGLCVTFLTAAASAQGVNVSARLSDGVVKVGGDTKLVIEVENGSNAAIRALPNVEGLKFGPVGQPAVQQFYSIQNGRQSQSRSLTWVVKVQPLAKGDYTIPPISVDVDGRAFTTRELPFKAVDDLKGDELGYFEIEGPKSLVEGQPFTVELRFGWEAGLTRSINTAKLSVPWLGGFPGLLELDPPSGASGLPTSQLLLNERTRLVAEQVGETKVGERTFYVLRARKRFVATRSGTFELPVSHFEFGRAGRDDIFTGRSDPGVAYFKASNPLTLEVSRLPEEGQPLDYSGAVGTLQAKATADRKDVDVGDSIKLTVDWTGSGNLEFFVPPDLSRVDAFKDFRVYGTNDRKTMERRSVTYDLAPLDEKVKELPPVSLSVYDPQQKQYVTLKTAPIPIRVRPLKNKAELGPDGSASNVVVDIRDIQTRPEPSTPPGGPRSVVILLAGAAIGVGWFALRTSVRKRGDPDAPRARAKRKARTALVRSLRDARTAGDEARALRGFLAARTGEPAEAWVGRRVREWAADGREAGAMTLSDADALELQRLFDQLDERTWNGRDERLGDAPVLAMADTIVKGGL